MRRLKTGKLYFLLLVIFLNGCRTDKPPVIEVCITDGYGAGDCTEHDHSILYRSPSQMVDYWCTNETDEAALQGMLATELGSAHPRKMFALRIHSRYNRIRAVRERLEIERRVGDDVRIRV